MDKVYVGTSDGGFAISKDGGETWTTRDPAPGSRINSIFAIDNAVYVGTDSGIAVSKNGGRIWMLHDLNKSSSDHAVTSVFGINNRVWTGLSRSKGRFSISNDNGQTWPINSELPNPLFSSPSVTSIYVSGNRLFVGSDRGIAISDDDGKRWKRVDETKGLGSNAVRAIAGSGNNVYVGLYRDGGTVSISEDGGESWGVQNTTPLKQSNCVNSIFVDEDKVYVATDGGLAMSKDVWESWEIKTTEDGLGSNNISSVAAVGSNIYLGTGSEGLFISRDGGEMWAKASTGLPSNYITAVFAHSV